MDSENTNDNPNPPTVPAAMMGLTCKHALAVFAQNETLKLQQQIWKLQRENRVLRHALCISSGTKIFGDTDDWMDPVPIPAAASGAGAGASAATGGT